MVTAMSMFTVLLAMLTVTVVNMKAHLNIVSFLLITIFSSAARYSNGNMNLEHLVIWSRI